MDYKKSSLFFSKYFFCPNIHIFMIKNTNFYGLLSKYGYSAKKRICWKTPNFFCSPCTLFWHVCLALFLIMIGHYCVGGFIFCTGPCQFWRLVLTPYFPGGSRRHCRCPGQRPLACHSLPSPCPARQCRSTCAFYGCFKKLDTGQVLVTWCLRRSKDSPNAVYCKNLWVKKKRKSYQERKVKHGNIA